MRGERELVLQGLVLGAKSSTIIADCSTRIARLRGDAEPSARAAGAKAS
jgi:hypothetical protein